MPPTLYAALPAEQRRHLWLPHSTVTLTLPMPSGEAYAFQTWFDPIHRMLADNVMCTGAPAPQWIQRQLPYEKTLPL